MFHPIYVIWALLPLAFVMLGTWALVKRITKKPGREYPKEYFTQAIFCAVAFGIAIAIDQSVITDMVVGLTGDFVDAMFVRWMLYPTVLLLLAYLNTFFKVKKEPPKTIPGPRYC